MTTIDALPPPRARLPRLRGRLHPLQRDDRPRARGTSRAAPRPTTSRAALAFARERGPRGLGARRRPLGHRRSLCDGVVLDVRGIDFVEVDPVRRVARVGGGATWAQVDRATQEHGLATTGGRVSTTGVAGLTLGGGSGWLERKHGLACDNLLAAELVTADGRARARVGDREPRAAVGAARRRRELRRRHRARVRAAPGRARGARRAGRLPRGARRRAAAARSAT